MYQISFQIWKKNIDDVGKVLENIMDQLKLENLSPIEKEFILCALLSSYIEAMVNIVQPMLAIGILEYVKHEILKRYTKKRRG